MATNREVCTAALRKIGVVSIDEEASAEAVEVARAALERLLRSWQNQEVLQWKTSSAQITLTTSASYQLAERAQDIWTCRLKRSGIETPMTGMSRDEYDELPNKASTGLPTMYYYDKQALTGTLYVWPLLASAQGETLEVTYVAPMPSIVLDDASLLPPEWEEAGVYCLAARLTDDFEIRDTFVKQEADRIFREALAYDRPVSVRLR